MDLINAGSVNIQSGKGLHGGNLNLYAGESNTGKGGSLDFQTGSSTSSDSGNIALETEVQVNNLDQ